MPTIWGLLFSRLQQSRTAKFTRSLLLFLALFACKHGAQVVADSIDAVQPGLTLMIMQTVRCGARGQGLAGSGGSSGVELLLRRPHRSPLSPPCPPAPPPLPPQVWLPTLPSISGAAEEKLLAVGTARMLADTQQLAAPAANELVGRLLAALVDLLEGGGGGSDGASGEEPGEEEYAGYSAAYARLHNAHK